MKLFLYLVWMFLFSVELGVLMSYVGYGSIVVYVCSLLAGIVLLGFADYLRSFNNKRVRRRVM